MEKQEQPWSIFTSSTNLIIEHQLAGSVPWGPDYLHLRSRPAIPYLSGKLFGDFMLVDFEGVFLQKWNHKRHANCDLVFLKFSSLKVVELITYVQWTNWTSEKINNNEILFKFSINSDLTYIAKRQELERD